MCQTKYYVTVCSSRSVPRFAACFASVESTEPDPNRANICVHNCIHRRPSLSALATPIVCRFCLIVLYYTFPHRVENYSQQQGHSVSVWHVYFVPLITLHPGMSEPRARRSKSTMIKWFSHAKAMLFCCYAMESQWLLGLRLFLGAHHVLCPRTGAATPIRRTGCAAPLTP